MDFKCLPPKRIFSKYMMKIKELYLGKKPGLSDIFHGLDRWSLRKECPNTEFFLIRIFVYLDCEYFRVSEYTKIRAGNNSVFGNFSCSGLVNWEKDSIFSLTVSGMITISSIMIT